MERIGIDWGSVFMLLTPFVIFVILFFKAKNRITKIECIMAGIACLLGFLSYSIPITGTISSPVETAGISISFGVISGIALLVIGLIEIKKFENNSL